MGKHMETILYIGAFMLIIAVLALSFLFSDNSTEQEKNGLSVGAAEVNASTLDYRPIRQCNSCRSYPVTSRAGVQ
jgi:flagellar basal body-associated protein FliL